MTNETETPQPLGWRLTAEHAASSNGQPALVAPDGTAYPANPIRFTRAEPHHAADVAWVAPWPAYLPYPGAGVARLILHEGRPVGVAPYGDRPLTEDLQGLILEDGRIIPWHNEMTVHEFDALLPGVPNVIVSGWEIVVLRGTAADRLISTLEREP